LSKTGAYGGTAYGDAHYGGAYYGAGGWSGYHPPAVVNSYGAGCYNCGGWATAGAAAAGAALGSFAGAAAVSDGYSAGYAAGSAAGAAYAMGAIYAALPSGCVASEGVDTTYYMCGNTWFQPSYGANGVYYTVVPAP